VALAAAHFLRDRNVYRHGVYFLSLARAVTDGWAEEREVTAALAGALGLFKPLDSLKALFQAINEWESVLVLDDCGSPFANSLLLQILRSTRRLRVVITSAAHTAVQLPPDSGFSRAFVLVRELSQDACVQLIRRIAPGIAEVDALSVFNHSRQSPLHIREQLEALLRNKHETALVAAAVAAQSPTACASSASAQVEPEQLQPDASPLLAPAPVVDLATTPTPLVEAA